LGVSRKDEGILREVLVGGCGYCVLCLFMRFLEMFFEEGWAFWKEGVSHVISGPVVGGLYSRIGNMHQGGLKGSVDCVLIRAKVVVSMKIVGVNDIAW